MLPVLILSSILLVALHHHLVFTDYTQSSSGDYFGKSQISQSNILLIPGQKVKNSFITLYPNYTK